MGTIARAPEALSIFRQLLRTRKKCFAGDTEMMAAVAEQIRGEFEANRSVTEGQKLEQLLTKAREAVEFMQVSIVQAKLNERGNYEVKLRAEHQGGSLEEAHPGKAVGSS